MNDDWKYLARGTWGVCVGLREAGDSLVLMIILRQIRKSA